MGWGSTPPSSAKYKGHMAYRTLHTYGVIKEDTAAIIRVDNQLVHNGPLNNGLLFEFITDVTLHGKVIVSIEILYGSVTITHNRATYPALVKGVVGFVNIPQPIVQTNLPLVVSDNATYEHYMFNGPNQWIINSISTERLVVVDNFYSSVMSGFIRPDWQYNHIPVDLENLNDISKLK